jgi:hypothetical protein
MITAQNEAAAHMPWIHMGLAAIITLLLFFVGRKSRKYPIRSLLWCIALILDVMLIDHSLIEIRPSHAVFSEKQALAAQFKSEPGEYRIFSPSYSLPQHIASKSGLQLADGVDPLQLRAYWDYMAHATGFPEESYSVTIPPFPSGDPSVVQDLRIDTRALGAINIGFIVSEYPLEGDGLIFLKRVNGTYIYANRDVRPRAWVEHETGGKWEQVDSISWSPDHIEVIAQGEGRLVLSEINYPGWIATIDGERAPIEVSYHLLRSVSLGQGEHVVEFHFRPCSVIVGAAVTMIAVLSFLLLWWRY